jgi:hypothetical protein
MKASLLLNERRVLSANSFAEAVVWVVPKPVKGSRHEFKYSLSYVVNGVCVVRYDNETGKGDHRHVNDREAPYLFISVDRLLEDFWNDVKRWSR